MTDNKLADALRILRAKPSGYSLPEFEALELLHDALAEHDAQPAPAPVQVDARFLCGGARFKLAAGKNGAEFSAFPAELAGQWIALVDATDNRHMTAAQPPAPGETAAAVRTLTKLGYTYHGSVLWKPPLGKPPVFDEPGDAPNESGFEQWYVENAFDYERNPIGCRDCGLMRKAWHAALAALRQPVAWQPIETAPKNRKLIVGYHNKLGNWRTVIGRYYETGTLESDDDDFSPDDGYAPEGWYEESESHETILRTDEPPTHWQPLPVGVPAIAHQESRNDD